MKMKLFSACAVAALTFSSALTAMDEIRDEEVNILCQEVEEDELDDEEFLATHEEDVDEDEDEEFFASCADGKCPKAMIERQKEEKRLERSRKQGVADEKSVEETPVESKKSMNA